jgi:hypothetical protein
MRWGARHDSQLKALWPSGMPQQEIAAELGFTPAYISIRAAALDLPPRGRPRNGQAYWQTEAAKRGVSERTLKVRLMTTIERDRLVTAVLDDER